MFTTLLKSLFGDDAATSRAAPARPSLKVSSQPKPQGQPKPVPKHAGPPAKPILCPDMLALVAFDHRASVVSPFAGAFSADFARAVEALPLQVRGGLTDIASGLKAANDLLAVQPKGLQRRIWLLTDGHPNPPDQPIWQEVTRARDLRVNINCVGFGNTGEFDRTLLERIANVTHRGRYVEAAGLAALSAAFRGDVRPRRVGSHRGEATAFVIDVSGSMSEPMGERRRIDAVAAAMFDLIKYKQRMWS